MGIIPDVTGIRYSRAHMDDRACPSVPTCSWRLKETVCAPRRNHGIKAMRGVSGKAPQRRWAGRGLEDRRTRGRERAAQPRGLRPGERPEHPKQKDTEGPTQRFLNRELFPPNKTMLPGACGAPRIGASEKQQPEYLSSSACMLRSA